MKTKILLKSWIKQNYVKSLTFQNMLLTKDWKYLISKFRPQNPMDGAFSSLTTKELIRMLDLLDMLERKQPVDASEEELAKLIELLNYSRKWK